MGEGDEGVRRVGETGESDIPGRPVECLGHSDNESFVELRDDGPVAWCVCGVEGLWAVAQKGTSLSRQAMDRCTLQPYPIITCGGSVCEPRQGLRAVSGRQAV